jgi:hypothetical protein
MVDEKLKDGMEFDKQISEKKLLSKNIKNLTAE